MSPVSDLLHEVDQKWRPLVAEKIALRIIGATALLLQTDYDRVTKDSDVLETDELEQHTRRQLLAMAGRDTPLALKHRLYIDPVPPGLPFLPHGPRWHPMMDLSRRLRFFDIHVLDVEDVVVSKMLRFSANDRSDIFAMIDRDLVDHARLVLRFASALDVRSHSAHSHQLRSCIDNFQTVERDAFGSPETQFALPPWVDD